jgi:molybdopterin converting factor small subunit
LFFAQAAEAAGVASLELVLPEGSTLGGAWDAARAATPGLSRLSTAIRFARNHVFTHHDATLADGDELAAIPPISGGLV